MVRKDSLTKPSSLFFIFCHFLSNLSVYLSVSNLRAVGWPAVIRQYRVTQSSNTVTGLMVTWGEMRQNLYGTKAQLPIFMCIKRNSDNISSHPVISI